MKKYEKLYKKITSEIDLPEYNKWYKRKMKQALSKNEIYLIYSGIRLLGKYEKEKYPNEHQPLMTKKESEYYKSICAPSNQT